MKQTSSSKQVPASDEAPRLTAGDLARATLRVGGQEVSRDKFATAVQVVADHGSDLHNGNPHAEP
ncbi:hypothetical protein [uncultured Thiodictyon sp.]|uniref:hypothetical protein n=1 Tax=uncultured Thiodictyon sp. TaxID=1846217 RepID=UPI0025FBF8B7|nr:hypothetical protein [uncultured Thiodictyon sp.]